MATDHTPAASRRGARALFPVEPRRVRYIKLGAGGEWERECFSSGLLRVGFETGRPEMLELCRRRQWDAVATWWREQGGRTPATATRFAQEVRHYVEDDGSTLWLSFDAERLYWGFLDPASTIEPHPDGNGSVRRLAGGWSCRDAAGNELRRGELAGSLTKLSMYRGTSCEVDVAEYAVRRINGSVLPEVAGAQQVLCQLQDVTVGLMRLLEPADFELLVDLVFAASGWQRQGAVGKTQKTLDLELRLPTTGEQAYVQVKSRSTQVELDAYVDRFAEMNERARVFFVYHTAHGHPLSSDNPRVNVLGPEQFAALVIDAGLVRWLVRKVQ